MSPTISDFAQLAANAFGHGRVVPFLGAGVNLADRPDNETWEPGKGLPSGAELASTLAKRYPYPSDEPPDDLPRVTQYIEVASGETAIYDEFRELFAGSFKPTTAHRVLAELPSTLRQKGRPSPYLLVVTTNYDDALEQAFDDADEEYDVVWYMAHGDFRGQFVHQSRGSEPTPIDDPSTSPISVEERNVVLKIHGAAHRPDPSFDSYVVTEDHYIEYLHGTDLLTEVPVKLKEKMIGSNFLFLGYRLGDWNLRVFLHGLWAMRDRTIKNWAVDRTIRELDRKFWQNRSVYMLEAPLTDYMTTLRERLERL
jgi:hypothetical protein